MSRAPVFALGDGRELRALQETDCDELFALVEANREHLARWMRWAADQDRAQTLAFIRHTRVQHAAGDGFQGAVVQDGRIIGVAGMHRIDWANRAVELGYWLAADAQGTGVMSAAVATLTRHALQDLHINRVEIRAAVHNERSRALIERLGFSFEGVARQGYRVDGGYHDDAVYAMLAADLAGAAARALDRGGARLNA